MRIRAGAALGFLAVIFTLGCGSIPKTYYYTVQAPALPAAGNAKTTYALGVEHFRAPEILRDDRIVYYLSPTEINYYEHHRWGAEPATLLSEFTVQWLESSGVFAQVNMFPLRERADYTLGGEVLNFEEVDSGGGAKVRLGLDLSLVRSSDGKLVWSGRQKLEMPVQGPGVEGVSSTLNAACAQALGQMVPGLLAQVEQDFKNGGK